MAKIKPARGSRKASGPKNPGAIGCLVLFISAALLLAILLYYAFIYSARSA